MDKFFALLALALTIFCASCSKDETIPADANDNFITALTLSKDGKAYSATINGKEITMTVPYIVDLNGASAIMNYTSSATIIPDPTKVTNWDSDMQFRVTSYNGATNDYTYRVVKTEIESQGNVVLKTQAEVDAFADTKITIVKGDLIIGDDAEDAAEITKLDALSGIKEVEGRVIILNNYAGETLDGLNATSIGGLQLGTSEQESNAKMYRLHLENTQTIKGDVSINSPGVQFVELDNVSTIEGSVYLHGEALTTLSMPKLTQVKGNISLSDNEQSPLTSVDFPALEKVEGTFTVPSSDNLESILLPKLTTAGCIDFYTGFGMKTISMPEITEVNGDLTLTSKFTILAYSTQGNLNLEKFDGLDKITSVKGTITIAQWDALSTFPSFSTLKELGALNAYRLKAMHNVDAISNCDLSNADFKEFNGQKPFIRLGDTYDMIFMNELKTKDDLSEVDLYLQAMYTNEEGKLFPAINLKKIHDFTVVQFAPKSDLAEEFPVESVCGNLHFESQTSVKNTSVRFSNLKSVEGYCYIKMPNKGKLLDLSNLETVGSVLNLNAFAAESVNMSKLKSVCTVENPEYVPSHFPEPDTRVAIRREYSMYLGAITDIDLPLLEEVGGEGAFLSNFTTLSCPALKKISGELVFDTARKATELSLPALAEVSKITINKLTQLTDFSTFGSLFEKGVITEGNWSVSGCGYNPTYEDMKAGKYKPE